MSIPSLVPTRQPASYTNPVSAELGSPLGPYELGMMDALNGELCLPELFFLDANRIAQYVAGFESVRTSLLSAQARQMWSLCPPQVGVIEVRS